MGVSMGKGKELFISGRIIGRCIVAGVHRKNFTIGAFGVRSFKT